MSQAVKNVYTVTVLKALASDSTTLNPQVIKVSTAAAFSFAIPKVSPGVQSSKPLAGSF
jgi:hypothetical protein